MITFVCYLPRPSLEVSSVNLVSPSMSCWSGFFSSLRTLAIDTSEALTFSNLSFMSSCSCLTWFSKDVFAP